MDLQIDHKAVCNLSRVPMSLKDNPCYQTALQLLDGPVFYRKTALYSHYISMEYSTLFDLYGAGNNLRFYTHKAIFLPWVHVFPVTSFLDTAFIEATDGAIERQVAKIADLIESIQCFGFDTQKFSDRRHGFISGYKLAHGDVERFYVVSGNHRTAVLAAMFPGEAIDVIFEQASFMKPRDKKNSEVLQCGVFPIEFDRVDAKNWPSVKSGLLTTTEAQTIFDAYFKA
jgi:hypothetical protein